MRLDRVGDGLDIAVDDLEGVKGHSSSGEPRRIAQIDEQGRHQQFVRLADGARFDEAASVAEEVPVAFVYSGRPHVVMMCTPENLEDLAYGFSLTEGIVSSVGEIERVDLATHARGAAVRIAAIEPCAPSAKLG